MKCGQISEDVIQYKVKTIRRMLGRYIESQALLSSLASFIHHNYITEVNSVWLENINLSEAHASSLVIVTSTVRIYNVTGNIVPIISEIKCRELGISRMSLSIEDTAALIRGMHNNVERVRLDEDGPVQLDMDTLLTYDCRGHCEYVACWDKTKRRYGHQLATWAKSIGWSVEKISNFVSIYRKVNNV